MALWFALLCHTTALAYGLMGGVFLAFSDFIMRALGTTPGAGGIAAMQEINRAVYRAVFMVVFLGLVPVSVVIAFYAASLLGAEGWPFVLSGVLYVLFCFVTTAAFNVPMNTALDRIAATDADDYWRHVYLPRWTAWNTVRALACAGASALMVWGLVSV